MTIAHNWFHWWSFWRAHQTFSLELQPSDKSLIPMSHRHPSWTRLSDYPRVRPHLNPPSTYPLPNRTKNLNSSPNPGLKSNSMSMTRSPDTDMKATLMSEREPVKISMVIKMQGLVRGEPKHRTRNASLKSLLQRQLVLSCLPVVQLYQPRSKIIPTLRSHRTMSNLPQKWTKQGKPSDHEHFSIQIPILLWIAFANSISAHRTPTTTSKTTCRVLILLKVVVEIIPCHG